MKKIESQEDINKKIKRNQRIISLIMILLLGGSTLGYALMSQNESDSQTSLRVVYQGYEFNKLNGLWNLEDSELFFQYLPNETFDYQISKNLSLPTFDNFPLYLVNYSSGGEILITNLKDRISRYQEACLNECSEDLPIKSCNDSNILIFLPEEENKLWSQQNCVYIGGDISKGVDTLTYYLIGLR